MHLETGGGGSKRLLAAQLNAHHHITTHQRYLRAINYMIPQLFNLCY